MKEDKPTSFDIAYRAGVSQPTVSRALRDSPLVSKATRDKVQRIARELGYIVDKNAANLRSKSTKTLALLLFEDPTEDTSQINPFFLSMLGSITRACSKSGYDLLVSFQQFSDDWHAEYEDAHRADGLILLGYGDYISYQEKLEKLIAAQAHFILWGPVIADQKGCALCSDNHHGAYQATKHLLELGRKNIAFIGEASEHCPEFHQRYQGYCQALQEAGLSANPALQVDAESTEESGYQATKQLLPFQNQFDAFFATSDLIAIGGIKALQDAGLNVPKDIAVIGFDDIPTAAYFNPPLTTVHQDTNRAGQLLVENLLKLIQGETVKSSLLPTELVIRESCGSALTR